MEEPATSKFSINFVREVYLLGEPHHARAVAKLLKAYPFLAARSGKDLTAGRQEFHYVCGIADFTTDVKMQELARAFTEAQSPFAHMLLFVLAPDLLSREQLLFAQEIGARYVCAGARRGDEFRDYLKRSCVEAHQVGSVAAFEAEYNEAAVAEDKAALARLAERLKALPAETEDVLRLMASVALQLGDNRRAEAYLKRLLGLNPQSLWAANTLGKLFLRSGRGALGLEVLQKLSLFHELNSERLLVLGNALAMIGKTREAEDNFKKGDALTGGGDERFQEGLAKVKLVEHDVPGALACLGGRKFSEQMISFLNMRAILATRSERFDEGIEYYANALQGAQDDGDVKAKLLFNMGLAYVRAGDLAQAQIRLRESVLLGGDRFQRARGPFEAVTGVLKARAAPRPAGEAPASDAVKIGEDVEWETLY